MVRTNRGMENTIFLLSALTDIGGILILFGLLQLLISDFGLCKFNPLVYNIWIAWGVMVVFLSGIPLIFATILYGLFQLTNGV